MICITAVAVEPTTLAELKDRRDANPGRSQIKYAHEAAKQPSRESLLVLRSRLLNATTGKGFVPDAHALTDKLGFLNILLLLSQICQMKQLTMLILN